MTEISFFGGSKKKGRQTTVLRRSYGETGAGELRRLYRFTEKREADHDPDMDVRYRDHVRADLVACSFLAEVPEKDPNLGGHIGGVRWHTAEHDLLIRSHFALHCDHRRGLMAHSGFRLTRYQFGEWETARVNIDYHIEVERHYYSVRYALVHQQMDVHVTGETVEVIHRGVRVASHARSYVAGKAITLTEHMPKAHQKYVGWTPSRLIEDAQQTGPYTEQLVEAILAAKRHPKQGYRLWLGILRLAKTYLAERMQAAARRCLRASAYNCQSMDSILKYQLDRCRCLAIRPFSLRSTTKTSAAPITSIPHRRPSLQ